MGGSVSDDVARRGLRKVTLRLDMVVEDLRLQKSRLRALEVRMGVQETLDGGEA